MIRPAITADCINLAALSIQVWLNSYARDGLRNGLSEYVLNTFSQKHFEQLLSRQDYQILVYEQQEHLLGFIALDLKSQFETAENGYEVDTLYVQNRHQGKGVGRQLLQAACNSHGKNYWLTTWVGNLEGLSFYQHLGFKDIGEYFFELEGEQHENRVLAFKGK
ncbi:N-acetyltransferase ['Osedax' symbiont bacterium Rs2_46_30_T18]|nr:N-acetyltransferase ['Osedax' symbiont bacterium Rs2_46_30_T18]